MQPDGADHSPGHAIAAVGIKPLGIRVGAKITTKHLLHTQLH